MVGSGRWGVSSVGRYVRREFSAGVGGRMGRWFGSGIGKCYYSSASLHVSELRDILSTQQVLTTDIERYTRDWTGHYSGGKVVAFPTCTEEVSNVMKYCHSNDIAVVMQGGNTGLVGGSVGLGDELIMSTARMNQIHELDETSAVLVCDAGVILENANNYVAESGFMMPVDLGAKASCMIGGNVSTNAGGLRVVKYGSLHANVVGLECVLADGTVLDMLRVVQKDNCGYHLKHLFIGSEGTLGIVTKVAIMLYPLPSNRVVAIVKLPTFDDVSELLRSARNTLGETLSAFEYMDGSSIDALADQYPINVHKFKDSIFKRGSVPNYDDTYVLIEASTSTVSGDGRLDDSLSDKVQLFLAKQFERNIILDAVIAQDGQQEDELWKIRELIPVALAQMSRNNLTCGPFLLKYDISLPWQETEVVVSAIQKYMSEECKHVILDREVGVDSVRSNRYLKDNTDVKYVMSVFCFGHAGDQNLHLNVILRLQENITETEQMRIKKLVKDDLEQAVLTETMKWNGSISAEHGVGQQKSHLLHLARSASEVQVMKLMKKSLDPKCILNPGKVISLEHNMQEGQPLSCDSVLK